MSLRVTSIRPMWAPPSANRSGLVAWVSCVLDGQLLIDGLAVRRTVDGRHVLTYPVRRDGRGREHAYFIPLGEDARAAVERQILAALDLAQEAAR